MVIALPGKFLGVNRLANVSQKFFDARIFQVFLSSLIISCLSQSSPSPLSRHGLRSADILPNKMCRVFYEAVPGKAAGLHFLGELEYPVTGSAISGVITSP